jgi:hypothetical protein
MISTKPVRKNAACFFFFFSWQSRSGFNWTKGKWSASHKSTFSPEFNSLISSTAHIDNFFFPPDRMQTGIFGENSTNIVNLIVSLVKKKIELGKTRNWTRFVRALSIHPRMTDTKDSQQTSGHI